MIRDDRAQFVLLAGVVVAVALVAMLTAYLQLGYHADVDAEGVDRPVADGQAYLERTTHEAAREVDGRYDWSAWETATERTRDRIEARTDAYERVRAADGVAPEVGLNATVARAWAAGNCPGGPDRAFGPCEADAGVVVQERAGETYVLAVAYDLTVTTASGETRLQTVVEATGRTDGYPDP